MNRGTHEKTTVMLLDDHPMIRLSIEMLINKQTDMCTVGSYGHSRELWDGLRQHQPDVLVLDYILGCDELDGLSLIKQILTRYPNLAILLFTSMDNVAVIRAAFQRGIKGYLSKREGAETYLQAIRFVSRGHGYIPAEIDVDQAKSDRTRLDAGLSPREAEVIRCILDGMKNSEIAEKLKRSRKTISGHKQAGMKKLGINSDLALFKYRDDLFR